MGSVSRNNALNKAADGIGGQSAGVDGPAKDQKKGQEKKRSQGKETVSGTLSWKDFDSGSSAALFSQAWDGLGELLPEGTLITRSTTRMDGSEA